MHALGLIVLLTAAAPDPAVDLKLTVRVDGSTTLVRGEYRGLKATLVNTSRTHSHWVVKSNDGSEMGWREPWVFVSAEEMTPGGPVPVSAQRAGRCGLYAQDWPQDIVKLGPGERLEIGWLPSLSWALDLPNQGKVTLKLHYTWRKDGARRSGFDPTGLKSPIAKVAPFEVVSDPIELTITSPVSARLAAKKPNRAGTNERLDRLFDFEITRGLNRATAVRFELRNGKHIGHRPHVVWTAKKGLGGNWDYPEGDTLEARALIDFVQNETSGQAKTPWVAVQVLPER